MLDASGAVLNTYVYDAFGNITNKTGNADNPYTYCGEYTDKETGNIYLRARYYDPGVGRFLSQDPYWTPRNRIYGSEEDVQNPNIEAIRQSVNLYAYCANNPVMFVDPTGYWAEDGSDERFKINNPIVYQALSDLSQTWINLDELEKQGIDIGNMKEEVAKLANMVRSIGDKMIVTQPLGVGGRMSNTEIVVYNSDRNKGNILVSTAVASSIPGMVDKKYKDDGTIYNAMKHASWNATATILTGNAEFVKNFTNAHEFGYPVVTADANVVKHTQMDLFNNQVGRYQGALAAQKTKDKENAIRIANNAIVERAYSGGLIVVVK